MNENVIQNQISLVGFKAVKIDFSCIENSSIPEETNPGFDLKLSNELILDSPNHFVKVFQVNIFTRNGESSEFIELNIDFQAIFRCGQKVDEEFLKSDFVKISAPAIGFPFLRALVSNITIQAGIAPILLPSINFIQFNQEAELK